jgi:hypothetical protein
MYSYIKPILVVFTIILFVKTAKAQDDNVEKIDNGAIIYFPGYKLNSIRALKLEVVSAKIIHVIECPELPLQEDTSLMVLKNNNK